MQLTKTHRAMAAIVILVVVFVLFEIGREFWRREHSALAVILFLAAFALFESARIIWSFAFRGVWHEWFTKRRKDWTAPIAKTPNPPKA